MSEKAEDNVQEEVVETTENVESTEEEVSSSSSKLDLGGLEFFYEEHKSLINYGGGGLLAVIALFCAYTFYWLPGKEKEAANEIFWAQNYFERDSFKIALNGGLQVRTAEGDKQMMGFEQVADEFGLTNTGTVAHYYAGICYLRLGQFEKAIEQLQKYDGKDEMISSIAIGAIGDAHLELNKSDEAVKYYLKAAENRNNGFTTPYYLKKAGFVYELQNNFTEALSVYERIKKEYSKSTEAREIDKQIAKVKTAGNL